MKKITNPDHLIYKTDSIRNYVQSENIVKLLHEKRILRGSRQIVPLLYQQILEILTEPGDAILDLTARTSIFSLTISVVVSYFLIASMLIS